MYLQKAGLQLLLVLSVLLNSSNIFSQQRNHEKVEHIVTASDIDRITKETDFNGNLVSEIHRDNRNIYYAIQTIGIDSKYVKLRILEQVYADSKIVHIGMSNNMHYIWFLVHNNPSISSKEVINKLDRFYENAKNEMSKMTMKQIEDWIMINDKREKINN